MGERKAGAANVHTDRDQAEAIRAAVPEGDALEILPPELDVSGGLTLEQRPSLRVAVEGVESGRFAGVIVAYQSRLFRNVEEEEAVWRRVEAAGGDVLLALERIDTSTVTGRMTRRIKAAFNAAEREEHVERFDKLRRWATEAGIWQRRQTPRGYSRDETTRRLVPDDNAPSVRQAFSDALAGASMVEIARNLAMTPSGVRHLLRNRVYLGELRVGRYVNEDAHPALIDAETFEAVGARLGTRPARSGPVALLAGLVRCCSCGHVMTRGSSRGGQFYRCPTHHSGKRCPEPVSIAAGRLERHVEPIALAEIQQLQVEATRGDRVGGVQREVAKAERALDAYLEAVSAEDVGAEAFARAARHKRQAVDEARERLRVEQARAPVLPALGSGVEVWAGLNPHERNALLRSLLAAVVVRRVGRVVPVGERVRVLQHGAPLTLPGGRGSDAGGIVPIPWPDADGVGVLVPVGEDRP